MRKTMFGSGLVLALAVCLACGGVGGGDAGTADGLDDLNFQPAKAKADKPEAEGLAKTLGFPLSSGILRSSTAQAAEILHPAAFDIGHIWDEYDGKLREDGWDRPESKVPPFVGRYSKDGQTLTLTLEQAGSSVMVRLARR